LGLAVIDTFFAWETLVVGWGRLLKVVRHRRLRVVIAVILVGVVILLTRVKHPETDDPNTGTKVFSLKWSTTDVKPLRTVRFRADQETGSVIVDIDTESPRTFYLVGDQLIVRGADIGQNVEFVSVDAAKVLPSADLVSASDLAASLARRPKECTFPSEDELRLARAFLRVPADTDPQSFTMCGSNAKGLSFPGQIWTTERYLERLEGLPLASTVVRGDQLDLGSESVLADIREFIGELD
jgi:hypothetical protein